MKKILITTNAVFIGIIIFLGCNKTDLTAAGDKAGISSNKSAVSTQIDTKTPCPGCYEYTDVGFKGVSTQTAFTMSNNYKTINQPLLQIDEAIDDANSIWFSLESLKNFIWKIEEAACKNNCRNTLGLGLRLYYARYPVSLDGYDGDFDELSTDFVQHHTLFIVPTFQDAGNSQVHWDFDPWHWGDNPCKPISMAQWFNSGPVPGHKPFGDDKSLIFSINEDQYFRGPNGTLSSVMNHGDLIPPYPSTGTGY